jgi:hypothetical protein
MDIFVNAFLMTPLFWCLLLLSLVVCICSLDVLLPSFVSFGDLSLNYYALRSIMTLCLVQITPFFTFVSLLFLFDTSEEAFTRENSNSFNHSLDWFQASPLF